MRDDPFAKPPTPVDVAADVMVWLLGMLELLGRPDAA
jgi:hypothetical protein